MDELMRKDSRMKIVDKAKKAFARSYDAEIDLRERMIEDLRFSFGDQWADEARRERESEGLPVLTMDRIGDIIRKSMAQVRKNRPSIKVLPTEQGDEETADIYTDLIREIEYASGNSRPYILAAEQARRMGFGVFRVSQQQSTRDIWEQNLVIKPVRNPFTVYFDPDAEGVVREDSEYCFVTAYLTKERFHAKFPKAPKGSWEAGGRGEERERWYSDGDIRVAEYWERNRKKVQMLLLSDGRTLTEDQLEDELQRGLSRNLQIERERESLTWEVSRYMMTGTDVLEKKTVWPGMFIPIVPVYGEEICIEGEKDYRGIVRTAKDAQQTYNYFRSATAEVLMGQTRVPFILGKSQVSKELARYWQNSNKSKLPFLMFDDKTNPTPPQRQIPPVSPQGLVQESIQAADDIQRTTGYFDSQLGAPGPEVSGRAILARQMGGDDGGMVFEDNLAASIEHAGRILVDLIPSFYDSERVLRLRGEDDSQRDVEINKVGVQFNRETQQIERVVQNDLTRGKYDVRVATGRGYHTRRLEAQDSMMAFLERAPQYTPYVIDLVAKNQDWPDAAKFAERLRGALPPGVIEEEDPAKQEAQLNQLQLQMQQLQLEMTEKQAKIKKIQSETAENLADAQKTAAETQELIRSSNFG